MESFSMKQNNSTHLHVCKGIKFCAAGCQLLMFIKISFFLFFFRLFDVTSATSEPTVFFGWHSVIFLNFGYRKFSSWQRFTHARTEINQFDSMHYHFFKYRYIIICPPVFFNFYSILQQLCNRT
jgi:hypothetical protein